MQCVKYTLSFIVVLLLFLIQSCSKDDPTGPITPSICFTVDGFDVTIHNMWSSGTTNSENLRGIVSFNQTISIGNETHTLVWTNIVNNYTLYEVTSFSVKIDGKDYSYPRDACNEVDVEPAINNISFKINDTLYYYENAAGELHYPYGYYLTAIGNRPEQYIIIGSESSGISQPERNKIIIGFINANGWSLAILYYDEDGNRIEFNLQDIDISILENRETVGEQMTSLIPRPIQSDDAVDTLSDLSFSVERIEISDPGGDPDPDLYLTHNTGNLQASIFNNGNIGHLGFQDYIGNGITFNGYMDAMFSAGLIFGTTSRQSVNGQIGSFSITDDLISSQSLVGFDSDLPNWNQVTKAIFEDSGSPEPYGLIIHQTSYSNSGENSLFIKYTFFNNTSILEDFYAGLFSDWDVGDSECLQSNLGGYDPSRNLAYQYCSGELIDPNYYGIISLENMSGARITTEGQSNVIRDSSYIWISTFLNESIVTPGDYRTWIGSGPFTLNLNDSLDIYFAIVAGTSLGDLKGNADAAIQKYNSSFAK